MQCPHPKPTSLYRFDAYPAMDVEKDMRGKPLFRLYGTFIHYGILSTWENTFSL